MGNTLGAIVFLAAATYLGYTVMRGRAQSFLAAVSSSSGSAGGGGGGGAGTPPPAPPIIGPLAGVGWPGSGTPSPPTPTVFSTVFGQNGPLGSPTSEGPYGVYSPSMTLP